MARDGDDQITVGDVVDLLQRLAPLELAAEWDNVGLLLGDRSAIIRRIMTCLTVTPEVVAEAVEAGVHLIVTHHPILFRPVQRLTTATAEGQMLLDLARGGIAVYSAHTAFDNSVGGINEALARRLSLIDVGPLRQEECAAECKLVVFVPDNDLNRVADALFAAGAGNIGQYTQCSFRLSGTGTFFGSEASNPTVGEKGRREEVSEWRLEVVCPEGRLLQIVAAMRKAHSYEEPAYDVYPLRPKATVTGEGRFGHLPQPVSLRDLANTIRTNLNTNFVQIVGEPERKVERVAVVCGAGGDFLRDAIHQGTDALVTGEMRFHDYLSARAGGIGLLLPGHYATERFAMEELAAKLQEHWSGIEVWASRREGDPVTVVGGEA
jgi:dinuclear metal center YbgI/SA1388 family protein